jgi:hypothetical protein
MPFVSLDNQLKIFFYNYNEGSPPLATAMKAGTGILPNARRVATK